MPRFIALSEEDPNNIHSAYTQYLEVCASSKKDAAKKLKKQGENVNDVWDAEEFEK